MDIRWSLKFLAMLHHEGVMVVDGDPAGNQFLAAVTERNFDAAFMAQRSKQLPAGTLEEQLIADGLQPELKAILAAQGVANAANLSDPDLVAALRGDKCGYAAELGAQCAADPALTQRMPFALREAIEALRALP